MKKELQEAIEAARGLATLLKSQMAFDFTAPTATPNAHHKAYTRRTRSGATSQIQARGAATITPIARQYQTDPNETYFRGDKARYTGKSEVMHGATFHEVEMIEGHMKGEKKWVPNGPEPQPVVVQHATPHAGHAIPPPPEVAHLVTQVETAAQGLLTNPAMAPHKAEIEEMISDLKKHPSAKHAKVVVEQMKELAESVAQPNELDPKGKAINYAKELDRRLTREFGIYGAGVYVTHHPGQRPEIEVTVGDWDTKEAQKFNDWLDQNTSKLRQEGIHISASASIGMGKENVTIISKGDDDIIR